MFTSFHENKFRYDRKGQLAPYFIFILVVLIVLAMVTVNLSKVAFIKTDSGNAVDAGGLASGSAMANVFNSIAQANSTLESNYWEFYTETAILISIATAYLISAHLNMIKAKTDALLAYTAAITAKTKATSAKAKALNEGTGPAPAAALAQMAAAQALLAASKLGLAVDFLVSALSQLATFTRYIWGITISLAAFTAAQIYLYLIIRQTAEKGRRNALVIGHKFLFMNSGIGAKLKEGEPSDATCPPVTSNLTEGQALDANQTFPCLNYRDSFSDFLKDIEADNIHDVVVGGKRTSKYFYKWTDGQDRNHYVATDIRIDPVNTFDLRVALFPWAAELALLAVILSTAHSIKVDLLVVKVKYTTAASLYSMAGAVSQVASALLYAAVGPWALRNLPYVGHIFRTVWQILAGAAKGFLAAAIGSLAAGLVFHIDGNVLLVAAIAAVTPIYVELGVVLTGLAPVIPYTSSSDWDAIPFIICWIDDVDHDRLVEVGTTQYHQGRDFGELWQARYPDPSGTISSYSITNFTGFGKIHPPNLRFDPSIIETDGSNQQYNSCSYAVARYQQLDRDINGYNGPEHDPNNPGQLLHHKGLLESADDCAASAADLQAQLANSGNSAVLQARITQLQAEETRLNNQAQAKTNERNQLVTDYPSCTFS